MKNNTAKIMIMKRTAGLILAPEDVVGDGGTDDDDDGDDDEELASLWKAPIEGDEGEKGGG